MGSFGVLKIPEWILKFAFVNVLWICFSLLGLLIFGLFPATISMFAVLRKWIMGETEIPIFRSFWTYFKKDFIKSNVLGLILIPIGYTLYIDFQLLQHASDSMWITIISYVVAAIAFMYILTVLYAFPVFVHYEIPILKVLKTSFLTMIVSPLSTIMMIAGSVILYFSLRNFLGLSVILGPSLFAFLIMCSAYLSFRNIIQSKSSQVTKEF
ncbi:YesL family protein [Gracilibacillus sp. D59]|uniref:YesL family protein n=1 Tax=Gracilibacillus sp. D59 TaxID=3457434 RepID=UPI003FCEAACC